jgi:hypothetical protein
MDGLADSICRTATRLLRFSALILLCIGLGTGGAHVAVELAKCGVGRFLARGSGPSLRRQRGTPLGLDLGGCKPQRWRTFLCDHALKFPSFGLTIESALAVLRSPGRDSFGRV